MIFASVRLALADVFSPPFRAVLWKTLGLAGLVLVALWFAVEAGAATWLAPLLPTLPHWAGSLVAWLGGAVLALALAFLIGPVSAVIAGLFLDEAADAVERTHYPNSPQGKPMEFAAGLLLSIKFFAVVVLGNLLAFALLLVPGVNLAAFFVVNGYLLGREYFEFAAARHGSVAEGSALRRRHRGTVLAAGFVIAAVLSVPIVNLLTPLFAGALMVHLHRRIAAREAQTIPAPSRRLEEAGQFPSAAPERRSS